MLHYDLVFRDHGGAEYSRSRISAPDDAAAIAMARRVHRSGVGRGFDILRGGVVIHREIFGSAKEP